MPPAHQKSSYSLCGNVAIWMLISHLHPTPEDQPVKAIRIHQPWALLVTLGEKRFETRSWHPEYRGRILIHASKTFNHVEQDLCHHEPFISNWAG